MTNVDKSDYFKIQVTFLISEIHELISAIPLTRARTAIYELISAIPLTHSNGCLLVGSTYVLPNSIYDLISAQLRALALQWLARNTYLLSTYLGN